MNGAKARTGQQHNAHDENDELHSNNSRIPTEVVILMLKCGAGRIHSWSCVILWRDKNIVERKVLCERSLL